MAKRLHLHLRNTKNQNINRVRSLMAELGEYSHYKTLKIVIAYGESLDCFDGTQQCLTDICEMINHDNESFKHFVESYKPPLIDIIGDKWFEQTGKGLRTERMCEYVLSYIKKYHKDITVSDNEERCSIALNEWEQFSQWVDKRVQRVNRKKRR